LKHISGTIRILHGMISCATSQPPPREALNRLVAGRPDETMALPRAHLERTARVIPGDPALFQPRARVENEGRACRLRHRCSRHAGAVDDGACEST
jgi:hypothetical protein